MNLLYPQNFKFMKNILYLCLVSTEIWFGTTHGQTFPLFYLNLLKDLLIHTYTSSHTYNFFCRNFLSFVQ